MNLAAIPAFASDDVFHVVVEAPRGSALKLKYEPQWEVMSISRPLPLGLTFLFDWGFVPSTGRLTAIRSTRCCCGMSHRIQGSSSGVARLGCSRSNRTGPAPIRRNGFATVAVLAIPVETRREHAAVREIREFPARILEELEQFTHAATALEGQGRPDRRMGQCG